MLSVANPPDPPCPSKVPALNSDEKGRPSKRPSYSPDQSHPADDPDEAHHPRFSIRDYVFSSRSRDGRTHWPFPQNYLQLCLKHGIRDLLPPFEPPHLVRARLPSSNGKHVPADHLWKTCPEIEQTQIVVSDAVKCAFSLPTQEPGPGSSHHPRIIPLSVEKPTVALPDGYENELCRAAETESEVTTGHDHIRSIPNSVSRFPGSVPETTGTVSESSSGVEAAKPPCLAENFRGTSERSIKKCRLIVKFGGVPESNRTEDAVSSLSSVSDSMGSKVCPVCKAFTSSSNTTLNAHIDQCLSVGSSAKWGAMKFSQHKVRPRKKRSMEEIYATAAHCTLEDLDRRNGTNWALDFSSMRQNSEALCATERKQPRISPIKATVDEREGAVYVDSNGMKLLILSKFNDAQSATAGDYCAPKKCKKELINKSPPFGKRKCCPQKHRKYLKTEVQRKKRSSFSRLKGEECELNAGAPHEKGMIIEASNAPEQVKVGKPGTLGHWICSKRSSLQKHLNSISGHRKFRIPLAITNHTSMESDQSASCDYFATGHTGKFGKSAAEILSTPNASSAPVPSDAALPSFDQGENTADLPAKNARSIGNNPSTSNSIVLRLPRPTEKCVSYEKDKKAEMHAKSVQKHGKFQSMRKNSVGCHSQMYKGEKGSRKLILLDEQRCRKEGNKCNEVVQGVMSKKLRKHWFAGKPQKYMKELSSELDERFHGSSSADNLGSTCNNLMTCMHQSNLSKNAVRPETSNTLEKVSTDSILQDKTADAIQADVCYDATEEGEHCTLNQMQIEAECHNAEMTVVGAQIEVPSTMDSMVKHPLDKSTGSCGSKVVISEDHEATTTSDRLDSCLSLEGESSVPKFLGDQWMHYRVIASDFLCQDSWQVGQIESSAKDGCSSEIQNLEDQAVIASTIQGSTAPLSRPEDDVLGASVASGRTVAAEIHNVIIEGEPSGSPVSAASTISHLSMEDLKFKDAGGEPSKHTFVIQETLRPYPRNLRLLLDDSTIGITGGTSDPENMFQRLKARVFNQKPEGFWDGQPCCCYGRESIPYKMLKQSSMVGVTLPTNAKQIASSIYMRPLIPSPEILCSHPKSDRKASPICDSPTSSSSVKASSDDQGRDVSIGSVSLSPHVQPQSTRSPVLRLMGKNLMVTTKEEMSVEQQNQTAPCSPEATSNEKYLSLLGFSSTSSLSNLDGIRYQYYL